MYIGIDVGTMNIVTAKESDSKIIYNSVRNMFIKINKDYLGSFDLSKVSHLEIDNEIYIIGEDAYNFANVFGKKVQRTMKQGIISSDDIDSVDVMSSIFKSMIGDSRFKYCVFSCPDSPLDSDSNVVYHREVIKRIMKSMGIEASPLNEATALIYANCIDTDFSGIGMSFGAGMTNIAIVYKAIPLSVFSLARGGDWIDYNVSVTTNTIQTHVTLFKETKYDPTGASFKNKKDRIINEAITFYYNELIQYVMSKFYYYASKIETTLDSIPIVVGGGTSLAKGFIEILKNSLDDGKLPFEISDIKYAKNPLTDVAEGCLVKAKTIK
ncbi:MAG: hypothetical protein QXD03_01925 [Candidatus Anstonellales archaeon]